MSGPLPLPDRLQSDRERLKRALSAEPRSVRALSQAAALSERDVLRHLAHLQRSLKALNRRLVVTPATCRDCHFVFHKRTRLTRPGKCPLCRSTRLSEPMFSLTSTDHAP